MLSILPEGPLQGVCILKMVLGSVVSCGLVFLLEKIAFDLVRLVLSKPSMIQYMITAGGGGGGGTHNIFGWVCAARS